MNWRIPLADIDLDDAEIDAVNKVLRSRWLTMGENVQAFEDKFASLLNVKHAIAVANGTAALHLACLAVDLKRGDEAIVPSLTFVATANAIRYAGAEPVFADINGYDDLNISLKAIERQITERTRAILVVHYGGYACDMSGIMALAKENNLYVIEDAAHAVGSVVNDRMLGTWGDIGCFSFFSNKNMSTGEGGMLVTDDDSLAEKLRLLRSHGMTSLTWERHKGHAFSYDVVELGYNYRLDEIRAAIGLVQLGKLEENNKRRRYLTQLYWDYLQEWTPEVTLPFLNHLGISAAHLMPVLLPEKTNRKNFMELMKSNGIQTSIHYPPVHLFTSYKDGFENSRMRLPVTEEIASREVTLPLFPGMSDGDVRYIAETMLRVLN